MIKRGFLLLAFLLAAWVLWPDTGACDRHFKLMTFNVNAFHQSDRSGSRQLVESIIMMQNPQVLCLQEVNMQKMTPTPEEWAKRLGFKYSLWVKQYRKNSSVGLGLLSKFPIVEDGLIPLSEGVDPRNAQWAVLQVGDAKMKVVNLHLSNRDFRSNGFSERSFMTELIRPNLRTIQLNKLLPELEGDTQTGLVIAGDFNTFPWSKAYRVIRRQYGDAVRWSDVLTPTYKLEYHARIDYIFRNNNIRVQSYKVVESVASDHNPVVSEMCLKAHH